MTKHKHADVITAWANGETIQCSQGSEWHDIDYLDDLTPDFHSSLFQWRVKPKSNTVWVNVYPDGDVTMWHSKALADGVAGGERIACVPLTYTEGEGLSLPAAAEGL